jgi:hypothetical protein
LSRSALPVAEKLATLAPSIWDMPASFHSGQS